MVSLSCVRQCACSFMELFLLILTAVLDRKVLFSPIPPILQMRKLTLEEIMTLPKISWLFHGSEPRSIWLRASAFPLGADGYLLQAGLTHSFKVFCFPYELPATHGPSSICPPGGRKGARKNAPPGPSEAQLPSQRPPSSRLPLAPSASLAAHTERPVNLSPPSVGSVALLFPFPGRQSSHLSGCAAGSQDSGTLLQACLSLIRVLSEVV